MKPFSIKAMAGAALALGLFVQGAAAQDIQFFRIGTGGTAGTYYPIGGLIANAISTPPGSRACEDGGSCGVPGLIATVIFAIPAPIRLTRLGIISTPPSLVEAAQAFGATPGQVLRKVELPFAMPQIMAGLTQTIMLSLSMVVIAALVGAKGLGVPVVRALNTVNISLGFEAGLCIVILAIILDRLFRSSDEGDA